MKLRLKELRKEHKLSLRELDKQVNINYSQLARIERGESLLSQQHIQILTNFFGVSADYLLGLSDVPLLLKEDSFKRIPVYANITNIKSLKNKENIVSYLLADVSDEKDYFYYQITNDEMKPDLLKGDYALIKITSSINDDSIGLFSIKNNVLLRKCFINNTIITLRRSDSTFKDEDFQLNDIEKIGVLIGFYRPKV